MQKTYDTLLIVFSAFILSAFVYLIVGFALSQANWKPILTSSSINRLLVIIFGAVSIGTSVVALNIRRSVLRGQTPLQTIEQLQKTIVSRSIFSFALSEVPAILGLVLFLLSGQFLYLVMFCACSLICFILIKPSKEAVERMEQDHQLGSR